MPDTSVSSTWGSATLRAEVGGSPTGGDATGATISRVDEDADLGRRGEATDREGDGGAVVVTRSRLGVAADLGRRDDAIDLEGDEGVVLLGGAVVATCMGRLNNKIRRMW